MLLKRLMWKITLEIHIQDGHSAIKRSLCKSIRATWEGFVLEFLDVMEVLKATYGQVPM